MPSAATAPLDPATIRQRVAEILSEPAFGEVFDPPPTEGAPGATGWLEPALAFIATLSPLSLVLLAGLGGVGCLWLLRRWRSRATALRATPAVGPLAEAEVSAQGSRELGLLALREGRLREGISHLQRWALLGLVGEERSHHRLRTMTNGEAIEGIEEGESAATLRDLTALHEEIIYGGRLPEEQDRERALRALESLDAHQSKASAASKGRRGAHHGS